MRKTPFDAMSPPLSFLIVRCAALMPLRSRDDVPGVTADKQVEHLNTDMSFLQMDAAI